MALAALSFFPPVLQNSHLPWAMSGAAVVLVAWHGLLLASPSRRFRGLRVWADFRPQHYVQAGAQGAVLLYWGWYWPGVYDVGHLLAAQLLFAYAFDCLLCWTRRGTYVLGFAPVPVILSINLFVWFKADWFYLQFLLIAVGLVVKEFCRWEKDGQRVHIFNPSSLPLALFSLGLIITGTSDLTWGQEIATTLNNPPQIYLFIFLVSLPGQLLFGVATMTLSAVVTIYLFGLAYLAVSGTYYFVDAYVPVSVFLGMHLLFTDPSTSPRTELGRVLFGALYACCVIGLYGILGAVGAPRFYDKLLAVPIMNLLIQFIDRGVSKCPIGRFNLRWPGGRWRNLASVGLWTLVFVGLSSLQGLGDTHRGQWVSFWQEACADNRPNGCRHFGVLASTYCDNGSGWACNAYGLLLEPDRRPELAAAAFRRACDLGSSAGCANLDPDRVIDPVVAMPTLADYAIVLRYPKRRQPQATPLETYQLACAQGFADGCVRACALGDLGAC